MTSVILPLLVLCLVFVGVPFQTVTKPASRERAETAILDGLRLIDAKDYQAFLVEFMPPEIVKERTKSADTTKAWVQYFTTYGIVYLLPRMKEASKVTPVF